MVSAKSVEKQLKKLKFNHHSWGRSEARELPNILMDNEVMHEAVNGLYDGGFALLVATDVRVLLIDKKPLNYLTVEDFRFDMISEIDYSHRLIGAHITISAGGKTLKFTSFNQPRLRKLISHVQHSMADGKKKAAESSEDQKQHLEQINQQLQAYLLAQHQQQQDFQQQLASQKDSGQASVQMPDPIKPSPDLQNYLFAQSLLEQHKTNQAKQQQNTDKAESSHKNAIEAEVISEIAAPAEQASLPPVAKKRVADASPQMADLYAEGMQEIYGKHQKKVEAATPAASPAPSLLANSIDPLKIAYSKLPMALRNRRFGRPSFHSHSQSTTQTITDN